MKSYKGEKCRKKTKRLLLSKAVLYFLELHCVPGDVCGAVEAKALTSLKQVLLFLAAPLKLTTSVAAPETLMHVGAKGDF